jgi:hypothetical protein
MWGWIVLYVAMTLISALLRPQQKMPNAKPGAIGDKDMPIASQSSPVPVIFGTVHLLHPNVVWWGNLSIVPIKKKPKGKK